jgi:hypothetical protein
MKTSRLLILGFLFSVNVFCADHQSESPFDTTIWGSEVTSAPVTMGFGSQYFITQLMANDKAQVAYKELDKHGRIVIAVQKVKSEKYPGETTNRFFLTAYRQVGFTESEKAAELTIDITGISEGSVGSCGYMQYNVDVGSIIIID